MAAEEEQKKRRQLIKRPSKDNLNLVIAACAVFISAASFIATYVQSDAALNQVKAETWPYLQIDHGNTNEALEREVFYKLENVGVGPAKIKSFRLRIENKYLKNANDMVRVLYSSEGLDCRVACIISDTIAPKILPQGGEVQAFFIPYNEESLGLWHTINTMRWSLKAEACYCSLLDDCFETDFKADPVEVDECKVEIGNEFSRG